MISGSNIDYNDIKKSIIKSCACFSGILLSVTALFDYFTDMPDLYTHIWYLFSIGKPAIIAPLMYKDNIDKFEKETIKRIDALVQQLSDLEYIAWVQNNIFNNSEENHCLLNLDWHSLNETESARRLIKSYY